MIKVGLLPIGTFTDNFLKQVVRGLDQLMPEIALLTAEKSYPSKAKESSSGQFAATEFLEKARGFEGAKILALTDVDLYGYNEDGRRYSFLFGLAEFGGKAAVVSTFRLQAASGEKFLDRVVKEGIHELGHTLSLTHCTDAACIMSFADEVFQIDARNGFFCQRCRGILRRMNPGEAAFYRKLSEVGWTGSPRTA